MSLEQFDSLKLWIKNNQYSGIIKIQKAGITVFESASGYASKSYRVPNSMRTRFAHASVTKMFTAVAIMHLIESGIIHLKTPVAAYLCLEDSMLNEAIEVEHLLTHTSGVAEYFDNTDPNGFENLWLQLPSPYMDSLAKLLPLFIDETPLFVPGEQFDYSGAGFILLGLIVEKAYGKDYFTAMRELVFEPLYMRETDFIPLQNVVDHVAEGYIPLKDDSGKVVGWKRNIYAVPAYGLSDGGAFSTVKDLLKFMKALRKGDLLKTETFEQMLKPHVAVEGQTHYGYGFWVEYREDVLIKYGHTGEDPGVSARVFYYPEIETDVVLLGNHSFSTGALLREIETKLGLRS